MTRATWSGPLTIVLPMAAKFETSVDFRLVPLTKREACGHHARWRARPYTKPNRAAFMQEAQHLIAQALQDDWSIPIDWHHDGGPRAVEPVFSGPVAFSIEVVTPFPESRALKRGVRPSRRVREKPDLTNVVKTLEDVCTRAGVWPDDAWTCEQHNQRRRARQGELPSIVIAIWKVEEEVPPEAL